MGQHWAQKETMQMDSVVQTLFILQIRPLGWVAVINLFEFGAVSTGATFVEACKKHLMSDASDEGMA